MQTNRDIELKLKSERGKYFLSPDKTLALIGLGLPLDINDYSFCWMHRGNDPWSLKDVFYLQIISWIVETIPALSLQDVLELLPHIDGCQLSLEIDCDPKMIWYEDVRDLDESNYPCDKTICFTGETMMEAAYNALVWAIKEGYLETDKRK